MDKEHFQCIVKLEHVVNANLDMRFYTDKNGDNPLPSLTSTNKKRANADGAWRISDLDEKWLTEESMIRGEKFEYDTEEANKVLYQEKMDEHWASMGVNQSEDESGDESS